MKRVLVAIFMMTLFFVSSADAQIRKIPAEVTDAFKGKYPAASGVEWKDKLTVFQANFQLDGEKMQARFNTSGEWQETEKALAEEKLPTEIKDGFSKSKFTEWEVKEVSHIDRKDGSEQFRLLVRKNDLEKKYLFFDKTGKLIRDSITL